jgi:hypothetical protein
MEDKELAYIFVGEKNVKETSENLYMLFLVKFTLYVMTKWFSLLLHILSQILDIMTEIFMVFLCPCRHLVEYYHKLGHDRFFQYPFLLITH